MSDNKDENANQEEEVEEEEEEEEEVCSPWTAKDFLNYYNVPGSDSSVRNVLFRRMLKPKLI